MKKILIFEPHSNQALAISKYIKKYSNYYIVGCVEKKIVFNTSNYDEIVIEDYLAINVSQYDFILPMGANSSYQIVNYYKQLKYCNEIQFIQSNLIVFDKPKMLDFAKGLNVPIPNTFYQIDEIDMFPIFYKEKFENGGGIRGVAHNIDEIPKVKNLIYQEYINTPSTYGVGFLAKDGEILTYTLHKEVISYPIDGGSSVVIEEFDDKRLIDKTKIILKELRYSGWGLAEYKYCDKRNDFVFMEVNAKFWASIEFMLTNNPKFLQNLLNISYQNDNAKKILFINRLLNYSIADIFRNISHFAGSKVVFEGCIVYTVLIRAIPARAKKYVKTFIKKIKSMKNKIHD